MTSRLDRLFILLESGSSQVTRKLAAKQLGEVQLLHPHELHNLLKRTISLLRNGNWDTRIAAAQAIEAILSNLPKWDPAGQIKNEDRHVQTPNRLQLNTFDLHKILCAAPLSGSEGKEYDYEDDNSDDAADRILRQRQQLDNRLGFGNSNGIFSSINTIGNLVTNDDLRPAPSNYNNTSTDRKPIDDMVNSVLSSREINRARRKARQSALTRSVSNNGSRSSVQEDEEEPETKKIKIELDENSCEGYGIPDGTGSWSEAVEWPLEGLCERLWIELFSARWECRHGAATALREVLKVAGEGAGKSADMTKEQMEHQHYVWLEDAAVRLLWILALDRFGDFVSDQVVAPVRETCAQALGLIVKAMKPAQVQSVLGVLIQMLTRNEWETRHGGLLGIKYMLAVRQDLISELLPIVFPHIQNGLSDNVDDVGAVAASCLIPIANKLTVFKNGLGPLVSKLWDLLLDQDELASACNSFMGLLAAILSLPDASELLQSQPLTEVIPRLWPFLSHNTSSVRCATLQTLCTLSQKSVKFVWPAILLQEALRHIFQRVLVEHVPEIQDMVEKVWDNLVNNSSLDVLLHAACPCVASWLCLTMHPARVAFEPSSLIQATSSKERKNKLGCLDSVSSVESQKYFLGGRETTPQNIREQNVIRARCMASRMLGELSQFLVKPAPGIEYPPDTDTVDSYIRVMVPYLQSHSALQKLVASLVLASWSSKDSDSRPCRPLLAETLQHAMNQTVYYDEIAITCTRLLQETRDFLAMLKHYKIEHGFETGDVIPLEKIAELSGPATQQLLIKYKLKPKVFESLDERRKSIHAAVTQTTSDQLMLNVSTMAAIAGAATRLHCLPCKLSPLIKPLMESLKRETLEPLQQLSAEHLAVLTSLCLDRTPCPNSKIVVNLCSFVRADAEFTPRIVLESENVNSSQSSESSDRIMGLGRNIYDGILTLTNQQRAIERAAFKKNSSGTGRGPGRPPATDIPIEELIPVEDEITIQNRIQRRGGTFALKAIAKHFGPALPISMPKLWETLHDQLLNTPDTVTVFNPADVLNNKTSAENLISSLQILEIVCSAIHSSLLDTLFSDLLPKLCILLSHPFKAVRHMTARAMAALADLNALPIMEVIVDKVIPMLGAIDCIMKRQGAAELIACVVEILQVKAIPFVALLVVPLLGRMSDHDDCVRLTCTHSFARLIQLFPLEGRNVDDLLGASQRLNDKRKQHREFLEHLFQPKDIPEYKIPVPIQAELRSYQQAGVNWLAFLNKYRLHGVLCDDMGLGKTLQSICILAGDNYTREQAYKATGSPDCVPLPNLVICPPTLTGHWVYEVKKFLPNKSLRPLQYAGPPVEREALRPKFKTHNLIVASYDIVRKDINFFSSIKWNYCILDEGHIIKNGKTKASKAVKQLIANHRLILSGTPIQNNVLELWSLFDFLMPGFLGTEKQFNAKYSRPILASRDPKSSPKEQEAGALAMEALHRQVLPFLLRRMKQDVLEDLPPKITQDYYCDLSPLQELLYEDFAKSHLAHSLQDSVVASANNETPHVFQALRYLQNVCNHPKLVLTTGHPQYQKVMKEMMLQKSSLDDINHSAKLPALKQLLLDCGIGHPSTTPAMEACVNQHRALVFCQLKAVLDIIEQDLFKVHMPELTYLRLDGSIAPAQRHEVVTRFNNDPSIDVLLLTTQVGGLGLNLTGADTVVFVEHDWNPMRDLQAMDRAHRIGQKKVVNVYRLITRATLEERIMGLQKFKLLTANTVISGENAAMETMGTDQILDLFSLSTSKTSNKDNEDLLSKDGHVLSTKSVLKALPDLWQEKEYTEEYDLTHYVNSLNKNSS